MSGCLALWTLAVFVGLMAIAIGGSSVIDADEHARLGEGDDSLQTHSLAFAAALDIEIRFILTTSSPAFRSSFGSRLTFFRLA